jgi:hypothetical protein
MPAGSPFALRLWMPGSAVWRGIFGVILTRWAHEQHTVSLVVHGQPQPAVTLRSADTILRADLLTSDFCETSTPAAASR